MKTRKLRKLGILAFIFFCIFVLAAAGAAGGVNAGTDQDCSDQLLDPQISIITYEDVAPTGYVLEDNYGTLGVDHNGWVYHCISGYYSAIGIEDTAVFRYNSNTGVKQFLGTMREISEAEGNLEPGEEIAKIHAPVLEYNGKMYFASHNFHRADEIHRGGHFYSYDLTTGAWTDLSKHDSEGVSAPGQGIITMDVLRNHNKLVGFTYPKGEIITYDLATRRTTNHGRPISSDPRNVARHIAATDAGKVYFSYASYDTPLYEFDVTTGFFANTGFTLHYGWLAGNATNKARTIVYLLDWPGHIYSIDVYSGAINEIGNIKPSLHTSYSVNFLHGLALSHDETRLYTIPEMKINDNNILGVVLYEYEIGTGQKNYLLNLTEQEGIVRYAIGPAMAGDGSIYYHNHEYSPKEVKLIKLYSDCTPTVCSDGTPVDQCSTVTGPPWYCNGSGNLVENCAQCGTDTDSDGTPECIDNCPNDSGKTDPGACGCGVADTDSDGDGTPDCNDECPLDPGKTLPGICGCGIADTDSDGDGIPDCNDDCDNLIDSDGDGTNDCDDLCPNDPNKTQPGTCGCGIADTDSYGDGTVDCVETDDDNDGLADEEEQGPIGDDPNYDGNNDGIADSLQDNVASFHTYVDQSYVTMESPVGTSISNCKAVDNPYTTNSPSSIKFSYGFFEFTITGVGNGGVTTVILNFPVGTTFDTYYKYGPTPSNDIDHWYEFLDDGQTGAEINDNVITLHFVDGKRGDDDLTADGIVIDIGGPAVSLYHDSGDGSGTSGGGGGCFIGTAVNSLEW